MMQHRILLLIVAMLAVVSVVAVVAVVRLLDGEPAHENCPDRLSDPGIADYALDPCRTYRYVVRPAGDGKRFVLIRGAEGEETQADDIEVTPDSNLRLVNEFDGPIRFWIETPQGKTVLGFDCDWIEIPAGEFVDLRVPARADTDAEAAAMIHVLAKESGVWLDRTYGDTDPNLKVKPYP